MKNLKQWRQERLRLVHNVHKLRFHRIKILVDRNFRFDVPLVLHHVCGCHVRIEKLKRILARSSPCVIVITILENLFRATRAKLPYLGTKCLERSSPWLMKFHACKDSGR
jgi:hypothetical protein